jgi:hypothetical protein
MTENMSRKQEQKGTACPRLGSGDSLGSICVLDGILCPDAAAERVLADGAS